MKISRTVAVVLLAVALSGCFSVSFPDIREELDTIHLVVVHTGLDSTQVSINRTDTFVWNEDVSVRDAVGDQAFRNVDVFYDYEPVSLAFEADFTEVVEASLTDLEPQMRAALGDTVATAAETDALPEVAAAREAIRQVGADIVLARETFSAYRYLDDIMKGAAIENLALAYPNDAFLFVFISVVPDAYESEAVQTEFTAFPFRYTITSQYGLETGVEARVNVTADLRTAADPGINVLRPQGFWPGVRPVAPDHVAEFPVIAPGRLDVTGITFASDGSDNISALLTPAKLDPTIDIDEFGERLDELVERSVDQMADLLVAEFRGGE